jgi:hypothetical protein
VLGIFFQSGGAQTYSAVSIPATQPISKCLAESPVPSKKLSSKSCNNILQSNPLAFIYPILPRVCIIVSLSYGGWGD